MYRNLFIAWYCLVILALCFAAVLILPPFIGTDRAGICSVCCSWLFGFVPIFRYVVFRWEKQDERDTLFWKQATLTGFSIGFVSIFALYPLFAIIASLYPGENKQFVSMFAGLPVLGGVIIFICSFSVEMIRLYRKDKHTEHGGQNVS